MESKTAEILLVKPGKWQFFFYLNNIRMENELILNGHSNISHTPGNVMVDMIHVTDKQIHKLWVKQLNYFQCGVTIIYGHSAGRKNNIHLMSYEKSAVTSVQASELQPVTICQKRKLGTKTNEAATTVLF